VFAYAICYFDILPDLCSWGTWPVKLSQEHRSRVFEIRVLGRIFGRKREEVRLESWRRLRNEELHNLYTSQNIISMDQMKEDLMGGSCSTYGRDEKCTQH
jgi:hypothetical protein